MSSTSSNADTTAGGQDASGEDLPEWARGVEDPIVRESDFSTQHKPDLTAADPQAACGSVADAELDVVPATSTGRRENCQHQSCFGSGNRPTDEVLPDDDPAAYDAPVLRSSAGGKVHKLADDRPLPKCRTGLVKSQWQLVERADLGDDVEYCHHQNCFGPLKQDE